MKPFVFVTHKKNYYLYSPVIKKFLIIPQKTYENYRLGKIQEDPILRKFQHCGYLDENFKNYNRKIEASEIERNLVNIPQIVFEVTTHCNFSCKYCCFGENYQTFEGRRTGVLKFESAKLLLDYISELTLSNLNVASNTPLVISFYGGEPLLNISLIKKIVNYAKTLKFRNRIF